MAQTTDDRTLLARVAARDRRAFEALYHLYHPRLFGYLFRLTRRAEMVEELVNDVMLTVWQSASRFGGRSRPSTWILGIAYNKALKALSRISRRRWEAPPEEADFEPETEGPESLALRREAASSLGQALARLSPEQRAVVDLTFFHGCSYAEVAEIVGCPVNTVKTRMFHARKRLREILGGPVPLQKES